LGFALISSERLQKILPIGQFFSLFGYTSLLTTIALFQWATTDCSTPPSYIPVDPVNYPSNFQVENGTNLFIYGDYLYWIAQEDHLYYAHTGLGSGTATFPPDGNINFKGHLKKIKPEWDSGARIGLGLNFPKAGYDLLSYWTFFSTNTSHSISKSHATLFSIWAHPDNSSASRDTFAKEKWNLNINLFDLEWGRSSWFGGNFSLRPFFGLRGLLLKQDLKNNYTYNTSPVIFGRLNSKSNFHGVGLRAGANLRFAMGYGFSIDGLASASLLYGQFDCHFRLRENRWTIADSKDRFWQGTPSLQLALGLGWDTHFFKDRLHIEFHAGWEQNQWFSINQMNHFMQEIGKGIFFQENGNLSLQGLIAGGRFDF
jgi:hypothetical protein